MAKAGVKVSGRARKRGKIGPDCPIVPAKVPHLGEYFEIFNSLLKKGEMFWFRGLADIELRLKPSALRPRSENKRNKALSLVSSFKQFAEMKLERPPADDEQLKWVQLARHYGLPTRLLDWTKNAAVALYFACCEKECANKDGAVYVLNPVELNMRVDPKTPRVLDPNLDRGFIEVYLKLGGKRNLRGCHTIAINPTWNSARIAAQQGVFTIAGSRYFTMTSKEASSLVCVKIMKEYKISLLDELERVGVNEMSLFPELEHTCSYLKQAAKLD